MITRSSSVRYRIERGAGGLARVITGAYCRVQPCRTETTRPCTHRVPVRRSTLTVRQASALDTPRIQPDVLLPLPRQRRSTGHPAPSCQNTSRVSRLSSDTVGARRIAAGASRRQDPSLRRRNGDPRLVAPAATSVRVGDGGLVSCVGSRGRLDRTYERVATSHGPAPPAVASPRVALRRSAERTHARPRIHPCRPADVGPPTRVVRAPGGGP